MNQFSVSLFKIAVLLLLFTFTLAFTQGHTQDFKARSVKLPTAIMYYRLFIPKNYTAAQKYPVVVALHGVGERGSDNKAQIEREDLIWPWILDSIQTRVPHFIMVPQCPSDSTWGGMKGGTGLCGTAKGIIDILDSMKREFSVDTNRFYITGLSMGGAGTYHLLQQRPGLFAAAAPCAAGGDTSAVTTIAKTPFWAHHGSLDGNPPGDRVMADARERHGIKVVRYVSDAVITSPTLTSYTDAVDKQGKNVLDLLTKNAKPSWDSLTKAVRGGADHFYSELTGGDHRSGWMIAYHNPLLAVWMFSKVKGGEVSVTPRVEGFQRAARVVSAGAADKIVAYSLTGQKLSPWNHGNGLQVVLVRRKGTARLCVAVMDR
jgi:predicted peptidase